MTQETIDPTANRRRIYRHWRERFDYNVSLVFTKRLNLGLVDKGYPAIVYPGDALPEGLKTILGKRKIKLMWDARMVTSRESAEGMGFKVTELSAAAPVVEAPVVEAPKDRITDLGKGWFRVILDNGEEKLVRGRQTAENTR
jgi:hypothetical protein